MDFKLYFDIYVQCGTRTRNSLYILVILLCFFFVIFYNTILFPFARYRHYVMINAKKCLVTYYEAKKSGQTSVPLPETCNNYAEIARFFTNEDWRDLDKIKNTDKSTLKLRYNDILMNYQKQIDNLMGKRSDLRVFQLPLVGGIVDLENLSLLCSFVLMCIMFVVRSNISREHDALIALKKKIADETDTERKKEMQVAVGLIQLVSSKKRDNIVLKIFKMYYFPDILFLFSIILSLFILYDNLTHIVFLKGIFSVSKDAGNEWIPEIVRGKEWLVFISLQCLLSVILIVVAIWNIRLWNKLISDIDDDFFS